MNSAIMSRAPGCSPASPCGQRERTADLAPPPTSRRSPLRRHRDSARHLPERRRGATRRAGGRWARPSGARCSSASPPASTTRCGPPSPPRSYSTRRSPGLAQPGLHLIDSGARRERVRQAASTGPRPPPRSVPRASLAARGDRLRAIAPRILGNSPLSASTRPRICSRRRRCPGGRLRAEAARTTEADRTAPRPRSVPPNANRTPARRRRERRAPRTRRLDSTAAARIASGSGGDRDRRQRARQTEAADAARSRARPTSPSSRWSARSRDSRPPA
jgi:hypothetical protein